MKRILATGVAYFSLLAISSISQPKLTPQHEEMLKQAMRGQISPEEAKTLEDGLKTKRDDLSVRHKLLGY